MCLWPYTLLREVCEQLLMAGRDQRVYLLCAGAGGTAAILLGGLLAFKKVSVPAYVSAE